VRHASDFKCAAGGGSQKRDPESDQRQMEIGSMGAQRLKALQSESQRACLY